MIGYIKAADKCYFPEALGIAQKVNNKVVARGLPMILEDTGKDTDRSIGFIKDYGVGRKVTVAMVDNDPEKAVKRAFGRFQVTGRWSPADYIRKSFQGVWDTFTAIESRRSEFNVASMTFIYCDNSRNFDSKCWLKSGDQIWSQECFED